MSTTYGTLEENLNRLMFERKLRAMDLARELNIPQPTIHRIATGKSTSPHPTTLEPIAKYFDVTIDQLIGKAPIYHQHSWVNALLPANTQVARQIPIVRWDELNTIDLTKPIARDDFVVGGSDLPEQCFAVRMSDSSMEPAFNQGDILILSPNRKVKDRGYYLVKLAKGQQVIYRQLLIDVDQRYLKPINPDLKAFGMRLLSDEDQILAGLVEVRQRHD